jgi:hypothetical protein
MQIETTPQEEAQIAIDLLEQWALNAHITIDHFLVTPFAPWENRGIAVRGKASDGRWEQNAILIDNLNDPQDVDDAMIAIASAKGWAQMQPGRKLS